MKNLTFKQAMIVTTINEKERMIENREKEIFETKLLIRKYKKQIRKLEKELEA